MTLHSVYLDITNYCLTVQLKNSIWIFFFPTPGSDISQVTYIKWQRNNNYTLLAA